MPFLENACCNEGEWVHPITYFSKEDKNIDAYIELSRLIQQQVSQGYRHPYELQKSIELITEANELDPNRPKALFAKADILYYSGQPKAAEDLYVETLTKLPDHLDSYIEKGRIFSERNPKESLLNADTYLYHFNWIVGNEKKSIMKDKGFWII